MSDNYFDELLNATKHDGEFVVDEAVFNQLPEDAHIVRSQGHGSSNWNRIGYIEFSTQDLGVKRWFVKIATGDVGRAMLHGEYESMLAVCRVTPASAPRPLKWGACQSPDQHYFIGEFRDLELGLPDPVAFAKAVAELHMSSQSEDSRFGFHMPTYNGTLKQSNQWSTSWEEFYTTSLVEFLALEREVRGTSEELEMMLPDLFDVVIPRLLRPLESEGRCVIPRLLHGDLWLGNIATDKNTDLPVYFDAASYYGHHEYDLSPMRPIMNEWKDKCISAYHAIIPKDEPVEDWDGRNALYALRTYIIDSTLHPKPHYREILIAEMRKLIDRYPEGYEGFVAG